jgi:transcriptional regulator with XRE-family HTH domain
MRNKPKELSIELPITKRGEGINPIDAYVGLRLRLRRKFLGLAQEALAKAVGITFQQFQKYENGKNRISASKLFQLSRLLDVNVQYFFDGFGEQSDNIELLDDEAIKALAAFSKINDPGMKVAFIGLMEAAGEAAH